MYPPATAMAVELDMRAGGDRFQTWLDDEAATAGRGAFYVECEWLDDSR